MKYLLILMVLCSCVTRREIEAAMWNMDKVPKRVCDAEPELYKMGIYRNLDNGKQQFVSYCSQTMFDHLAASKADIERLVKKAGTGK